MGMAQDGVLVCNAMFWGQSRVLPCRNHSDASSYSVLALVRPGAGYSSERRAGDKVIVIDHKCILILALIWRGDHNVTSAG